MREHGAGYVLELERELDGTPEHVYEMLTEPAELTNWWGPHGFTLPDVQLDLRVGGKYRFTMRPPVGEAFHLSGDFLEILVPERLSYTFRWEEPTPDDRETVVRLTLRSLGEATQVSLSQGEFATEERLELHRSGWTDSLEKLQAELKAKGS
jgi:uncharacterized protein YndB with AHSA1/START domain